MYNKYIIDKMVFNSFNSIQNFITYAPPVINIPNSTPLDYNYNTASKCLICYSMRVIISGYTGPVIQLYRSDNNTTSDFYTDSLQSFFTTGQNNTGTSYSTWIGSSIAYVSKWYDQSGKSNHAVQTDTNKRPQIEIQNNKYVIYFPTSPGINRCFLNFTTRIRPNTVFAHCYINNNSIGINTLVQVDGNNDYSLRFSGSGSGSFNAANINNNGDWYYSSSGTKIAYNNNYSTNSIPYQTWNVFSISINTPTWSNNSYFNNIAYDINRGRGINGYIFEMFFHNTTMTSADMQNFYSNRPF